MAAVALGPNLICFLAPAAAVPAFMNACHAATFSVPVWAHDFTVYPEQGESRGGKGREPCNQHSDKTMTSVVIALVFGQNAQDSHVMDLKEEVKGCSYDSIVKICREESTLV